MIKGFIRFINENWDEEERFDALLDALNEALSKFGRKWSYSSMAGHNQVVEDDLHRFRHLMSILGWDDKAVAEVMKSNDWDLPDNLLCGVIDAYMYSLNNEYELAGYGLEILDDRESIIKFNYGWHRSSYGKMWLAQQGISPDDFQKSVPDKIKGYLQAEGLSVESVSHFGGSFSVEMSSNEDAQEAAGHLEDLEFDCEVKGKNVGAKPR